MSHGVRDVPHTFATMTAHSQILAETHSEREIRMPRHFANDLCLQHNSRLVGKQDSDVVITFTLKTAQ
jgi:hypothetical protein